jgi:CxxC-x17-CxxC domain-containing protein
VINMQDKSLTCRDCNEEFVFSASEQEFFAEKGFTNEPGRCPACRAARKTERGTGNRSQSGYSSIGRSSGGRPSGGYSGVRSEREMFPVVCARCGKDTQVPFQPRNDKPVYCSDCFSAQRTHPSSSLWTGRRSTY